MDRQGFMFGRSIFAWPSRENVSPFLLNANSADRRKQAIYSRAVCQT